MRQTKLFGIFFHITLAVMLALSVLSCKDDMNEATWDDSVIGTATLTGKVTDTYGEPLGEASILCMGTDTKRELRKSGLTESDGTFVVKDVPSNARYIKFSKEGYASVSFTLQAVRFKEESVIELNASLEFSRAVITGLILDASTGEPMADVEVTNGVVYTKTDENGEYSLEKLTVKDYDLRYTTAEGSEYSRSVSAGDFVDGTATVPVLRLGGDDVWPGRKWQQLADAPFWYGNEFRGSTGFGGRNDYRAGFMSSWPYYGDFRYEAEGCAMLLCAGYGKVGSPDFNAYTYGRKVIYEGNRYMNVMVRTHNANQESDAVHFGVEVLDLTANAIKPVKVGEQSYFGGEYQTFAFDLGNFVGHEVVIAYGLYWTSGEEGRHLPCRRIAFACQSMCDLQNGTEADIPGTKIGGLEGWSYGTLENITTLTVNRNTSFTGRNFDQKAGIGEGEAFDNCIGHVHNPGGQQGFSAFAGTDHIIMYWTFQYVRSVPEPVNSEGFTIKTTDSGSERYNNPDAYLMSKFNVGATNSHIHFHMRTFSSKYATTFRVTAITEDGTATALSPVSNTALSASEVPQGNGCWKFIHEKGTGNVDDYADFEYDLSAYKGRNVVVALSVHKGTSSKEEKLCIYKIELK